MSDYIWLAPNISEKAPKEGSHPKAVMPGEWLLPGELLHWRSMPTPYGRAETMRGVLKRLPSDGSVLPFRHEYTNRFRELVLGVASGALTVHVADLRNQDVYDNFGKALLSAEPQIRYLSLLVRPSDNLVFGVSHPACLFWPHARRTEAEWAWLATATEGRVAQTLALLAAWRESLRRSQRWHPADVEWNRGIDWLLTHTTSSPDLKEWNDHARSAPVLLHLAQAPNKVPDPTVVFFPQLHPRFADLLVARTKSGLRVTPSAIELTDKAGRVAVKVHLAPTAFSADPVALGAGGTRVMENVFDEEPGKTCLQQLPQALSLIRTALAAHGRELSGVEAAPFLYPDIYRVLVSRGLLWEDGVRRVRGTSRGESLLLGEGGPGRLLTRGDVEAESGRDMLVEFEGADQGVIYAERFQDVVIGDLSALGYALFQVFVGSARLEGESLVDEDGEPLLEASAEVPVQACDAAYGLASSPAVERKYSRRLATLQRFLGAYPAEAGARSLPMLLHRAARRFVELVSGMENLQPGGLKAREVLVVKLGREYFKFKRDPLV